MTNPELLAFINETPELQSLLYDLDLLPEQTVSQVEKFSTENIVEHFKRFEERLKT